jgi:hypothetical protein
MNTLYFLEEWRGEQIISSPGDKIHPGGQLLPWGQSLPLGSKFAPGGKVKNGPQFKKFFFKKKRLPGVGANPGYLDYIYFLIFTTLPLSHSSSPFIKCLSPLT